MSLARLIGLNAPRLKRRWGVAAAAAGVAAIMASLAVGFAAFSAYIALCHRFEPEIAALIVAGALLFLTLTAVVIAQIAVTRARREVKVAVQSSALVAFAPTVASMASRHTRLAAVVAAVGVGIWLARSATKN